MNFTRDSILQLIAQGENSAVEFKSSGVKPESLAREIVAFANGQGGIIFIGVDDSGEILGIEASAKLEEWVMNIVRNNVIPPLVVEYWVCTIETKEVAVITVPKGRDKPYQTADQKYMIRVGSTSRVAAMSELMRLFQQSGVFHYDAISLESTTLAALNLYKIASYFDAYKIAFDTLTESEKVRLLLNTDILSENEQLTVAGMLVFGVFPQRSMPNACISFARFAGNELSSVLIDKQVIEGTLDYQIDTCTALIKNHRSVASDIVGNKRVDTFVKYSEKVFRELIVNACCHRNYSIFGSRIRVFMFSNRLEVISPGRLPNTVTIEKLSYGVSYSINPIIVKFMENLGYIDKLGRGLPMVCQEAKQMGKEVVFEEIGEEFKVVLFW